MCVFSFIFFLNLDFLIDVAMEIAFKTQIKPNLLTVYTLNINKIKQSKLIVTYKPHWLEIESEYLYMNMERSKRSGFYILNRINTKRQDWAFKYGIVRWLWEISQL